MTERYPNDDLWMSEDKKKDAERISWIKMQAGLYDEDLRQGKMEDKQYHKDMFDLCLELDGLMKKYHCTDMDLLRKNPLKNLDKIDKIWRIVEKEIKSPYEKQYDEDVHKAIEEVNDGRY